MIGSPGALPSGYMRFLPWGSLWISTLLEHFQQSLQIFVLFKEWTVHFTFVYLLFQIHFSTDSLSFSLTHLNIIFSLILYSFFIIIYSSYIHSQQLYFSIKNIIFTIFFTILSQESYQNLMWKVVISSNLNPPLKLFFYSPILANNNLLLKIYCENIVVTFLNCNFFFFFILFFQT